MINVKTSIIIPCYNEEEVIRDAYKRVKNVLKTNFSDFEVIFINDGSKDRTLSILQELASKDDSVKVISFSRNFGHQPAVSAGINHCQGEIAIIIDADLQDPPELFPDMAKKYLEGYNVVYGVRNKRKGENIFKKITAKLFYRFINWLSDVDLPLDTGDFRLIDRKVMDQYNSLRERNKYIRGLITWIGYRQCPIYYNRDPRLAGETKYTLKKMIKFAMNGVLYFSKKPLQLATTVGFICIFVGLLLVVYVLVSKYAIKNMPASLGWASTLIIIIFFGGVQLLTIGVVGEYIGSIFEELKGRPEYIIADKFNFDKVRKEKGAGK